MDAQMERMEASGLRSHPSRTASLAPHSIIFERVTDMKYILILSIIAASLGSCAIVPAGYGDSRDRYYHYHDGYDRDRGYSRGDDDYRYLDYNRGRELPRYSYRDDRGNQGYPYGEHRS
jgi:hypothetical protein